MDCSSSQGGGPREVFEDQCRQMLVAPLLQLVDASNRLWSHFRESPPFPFDTATASPSDDTSSLLFTSNKPCTEAWFVKSWQAKTERGPSRARRRKQLKEGVLLVCQEVERRKDEAWGELVPLRNEVLKRLPRRSENKALNNAKHLLAGALSAAVSRSIIAPLERVKLEYVVRGSRSSVPRTFQTILATEGLVGFWKGNFVNVLRTAPFKAVNFFAFDVYRKHFLKRAGNKKELTNLERGIAGAAAGITATVLCFPMDTIRTRMVAHGGEVYRGVVHCAVELVKKEGPGSLYRGLLPGVISMAPAGAVFYGVYDLLKSSFLRSPEGQRLLRERQLAADAEHKSFSPTAPKTELGAIRTLVYGAIAGACAETATYPLEVIRRQLQMQGAHGMRLGLRETTLQVFRQGGWRGMYTGLLPSTLQVLPSAALSYYVYELVKVILAVD